MTVGGHRGSPSQLLGGTVKVVRMNVGGVSDLTSNDLWVHQTL
jgi:hypothetical protein